MKLSLKTPFLLLSSLAAFAGQASGEKMLATSSLNSCQADSKFTASLFNVVFTPGNNSASIEMVATSSIQGKVVFDITAYAYGYQFLRQTVDPCTLKKNGLCPMVSGKIPFGFNLGVTPNDVKNIPGIAYSIPDLDAKVRVFVNMSGTDNSVACLEANISNGKTVDLPGVKWATAVIAGLALVSSAVISGLGHSNAAAHVAANSLSLFGYFQSQAILGLTAVELPPIVQSWTQDFQWSMGVIHVSFMQKIFTWYQRATGGTPSALFDSLANVSVEVYKRGLSMRGLDGIRDSATGNMNMFKRAVAMMPKSASNLMKRGNIVNATGNYVVYGIQRVAYRAKIESTNIFLTCLIFFCIFVVATVLVVCAFKGFLELAAKKQWIKGDKFMEFRNGWFTILKGILFRVGLIGFPQMCIFCLWEFTQNDSPAEIVLAVFFFFGLLLTLGWGASKVVRIARRSMSMHRNPAYILFSDPQALNKWGFLYIQFRASAYYFIAPVLLYLLVKSMFVALGQKSKIAQAVAFVVIEAGALVGASVLRPWMDKATNSFNIAICAVNFINAIFLLIFSDVFDAPGLVIGVIGVVLFILNAAMSLILLLMVIITTTITFVRKNPDARYQFMADDRASFMKSQSQLHTTTELDALAATARGDKTGYKSQMDFDNDEDSIISDDRRPPPGGYASAHQSQSSFQNGPRSPVNPSMPLFPAGQQRPQSPFRSASPSPYSSNSGSGLGPNRAQGASSPSPWQRGAGYDH